MTPISRRVAVKAMVVGVGASLVGPTITVPVGPVFDIQSIPIPTMLQSEFEAYRQDLLRYIMMRCGVPSRIFRGG